MTVKAIEKSIHHLKPAEQLRIAETIFENLHGADPAVEEAWIQEAERRLREYKKGKIKTIPWEKVKAQLS